MLCDILDGCVHAETQYSPTQRTAGIQHGGQTATEKERKQKRRQEISTKNTHIDTYLS